MVVSAAWSFQKLPELQVVPSYPLYLLLGVELNVPWMLGKHSTNYSTSLVKKLQILKHVL